jgi:hypothetical protein
MIPLLFLLVGAWAYNQVNINGSANSISTNVGSGIGGFMNGLGSGMSGFTSGINNWVFPPIYNQEVMVGSNTYASYPDGSPVYVTIYRNATNPSYNQLLNFLDSDDTVDQTYIPNQYVCANFAARLFDDAEASGIEAHLVVVDFSDGTPSHMIDAFNTTDDGIVYIDDTGNTAAQKEEGSPQVPCSVNLVPGTEYIRTPLQNIGMWSETPLGIVGDYQVLIYPDEYSGMFGIS